MMTSSQKEQPRNLIKRSSWNNKIQVTVYSVSDLFSINIKNNNRNNSYTASDIEVLEGLEPVRVRPGMYIGGTDSNAMHHLVSEVLDNAMDEAIAGYASKITMHLQKDGYVTVSDNGRGIPTDNHPKFPDKSALEVILTTLHSGGKFSNKAYQVSGGLHGVGVSVVNALSEKLYVEVYRDGIIYKQEYQRGVPVTSLATSEGLKKNRGTKVSFIPDYEIFGNNIKFSAKKLYEMAKAKAYLHKGVSIEWRCDEEALENTDRDAKVPIHEVINFPGGLKDYLESRIDKSGVIGEEIFAGNSEIAAENFRIEWALCWHDDENFVRSYCNTIPTPLGGTHEQGIRAALARSIKIYGEMAGHKKITQVSIDDVMESICLVLSVFISNPIFQGQTKDKLVTPGVAKNVENSFKDLFDHWLSGNKKASDKIIQYLIDKAEERLNRKSEKNVNRKTATQRLRLPGKLADCTISIAKGTELFLVEGDSAGGSAKQARDRQTQAVLPLRGKILNVANATGQKILANQEIQDLEIALNCGSLGGYKEDNLRYEKIIIMTDADVDGAHIASLLMTFFYLRMPKLIENGHLYLAKPPLYRILQGTKTFYASDEAQKDEIIAKFSQEKKKYEVGRFKGLGEMTTAQLKETTMNPSTRGALYRVNIDSFDKIDTIVDNLMGKKAEKRFEFIQSLLKQMKEVEVYV